MRFTPLLPEHEAALARFEGAFAAAGEASIPAFFKQAGWSHADTIAHFDAWAVGTPLGWESKDPAGFVPCTTVFLEGEGELMGVFNFRHRLNARLKLHGGHVGYSVDPRFRRQGLAKRMLNEARRIGASKGIEQLLVTCAPSNTGSVKVIEAARGTLQDTIYFEEAATDVRRYWVQTVH